MRLALNFSIQIIWIIKRPAFLWDSAFINKISKWQYVCVTNEWKSQ
jgi:hypothetical protein